MLDEAQKRVADLETKVAEYEKEKQRADLRVDELMHELDAAKGLA
jgi:chaperonin cofactor prefoldin